LKKSISLSQKLINDRDLLAKFHLFTDWCTSETSQKAILKFTLKFTLKQLWHVSVQLRHHQGAH